MILKRYVHKNLIRDILIKIIIYLYREDQVDLKMKYLNLYLQKVLGKVKNQCQEN